MDDSIFWSIDRTQTLRLNNLDDTKSNTLCLSMEFVSESMWTLFNYGMEEFKNYLIDNGLYDESNINSDIKK